MNGFAAWCDPCNRRIYYSPTADRRVFVAVEYMADRYTPSERRHVCRGLGWRTVPLIELDEA